MPNRCCVFKCSTNTPEGERAPLFSFPTKDAKTMERWLEAIQRPGFVPTTTSKVCAVHFREEDLVWNTEFHDEKANKTYSAPLKIPRLKRKSVPCLFPERRSKPTPNRLAKSAGGGYTRASSALAKWKEIRSAEKDAPKTTPDTPRVQPPDPTKPHHPGCPLHKAEFIFNTFDELKACNTKFVPPPPWNIITKPANIMYVNVSESPIPNVTHIASVNANLEMSLYMGNMVILTMGALKFPAKVNNIGNVHTILHQFLMYKKEVHFKN